MNKDPWRCAYCWRLNRHNALRCGTCDVVWQKCIDNTYRHQGPRGHSRSRGYAQWDRGEDWQGGQSQEQFAPKSPRSRKSPRPKRGATPKQKKKNKDAVYSEPEPPWISNNGDGNTLPLPGLGSSDSKAEQKYQELIMELKKPGNTLTPGAQQILADAAPAPIKPEAPKNMQSAVAKLERARDAFQQAQRARQNLHAKWTAYIESSIERWKGFAEDFAERDRDLDAKVVAAREALQIARDKVDATKDELTKEDEEILEITDVDDDGDKMETADVIQNGIDGMVATMQAVKAAAEATEGQVAKRARTEGNGDGSALPSALTPFGRPGK